MCARLQPPSRLLLLPSLVLLQLSPPLLLLPLRRQRPKQPLSTAAAARL
jgi:hypothetical protein